MRTQKVYSDYNGLSDADLATLGGKTVTDMTDNAYFPNPDPDLTDYGAAVTDYRNKHETANWQPRPRTWPEGCCCNR